MMNGYLSYTLAALAIVGAGAGYQLGFIDAQTAIGMAWGGASLFGLRRAVATNGTGR